MQGTDTQSTSAFTRSILPVKAEERRVVKLGKEATSGTRWKLGGKKNCLLVDLDVKIAFNSAPWSNIGLALDKIKVPAYLRRMIMSYFND